MILTEKEQICAAPEPEEELAQKKMLSQKKMKNWKLMAQMKCSIKNMTIKVKAEKKHKACLMKQ